MLDPHAALAGILDERGVEVVATDTETATPSDLTRAQTRGAGRVGEFEGGTASPDPHAPRTRVFVVEHPFERSQPLERVHDPRTVILAARLLAREVASLQEQDIPTAGRQVRRRRRPGRSATDHYHLHVRRVAAIHCSPASFRPLSYRSPSSGIVIATR